MFKKNQNFIFSFDIYGISAKLNTFNGNTKTKSGLIISFVFIALSILYSLYTMVLYFKYSTPAVIYFKENSHDTNRTVDMSEPFLFGLYDSDYYYIDESNIEFEAYYARYTEANLELHPVNIERCEYGKNIDTKYKEEFEIVDNLYCLSDGANYTLHYASDFDFSQMLIYIKIKSNFTMLNIINSNSVVNHMKTKPLSDIYFTSNMVEISGPKTYQINYNLQYIKYETDRGLIIERIKTYNGRVFSDMNVREQNDELPANLLLAEINIGINNIDFDYYSRSYQRFQLVIVEIYWYVDIILLIGRIISSYFIDKEASIDIVKYLLVKNVIDKSISEEVSINISNNNQQKESIIKEKININNNNQQNETIFKEKVNINNNNKNNYLDNKIKKSDNKSKNIDNNNNEISETIYNLNTNFNISSLEKKSNDDDKIINVLNSLNYYHIIKSYFCFNDDRSKLINCCNSLISDELSIEKILRRINDMEDQINFILNTLNSSNIHKNTKFDEINELIDKIGKNNNQ